MELLRPNWNPAPQGLQEVKSVEDLIAFWPPGVRWPFGVLISLRSRAISSWFLDETPLKRAI